MAKHVSEEERQRRRFAIGTSPTIAEAARQLGMHPNRLYGWLTTERRHARVRGKLGGRIGKEDSEARMRAYEETQSDTEAAKRLGIRSGAMTYWRRRMGLPSKRKVGHAEKMRSAADLERRLIRARNSGANDRDAAAAAGVTVGKFRHWRLVQELQEDLDRKEAARAKPVKVVFEVEQFVDKAVAGGIVTAVQGAGARSAWLAGMTDEAIAEHIDAPVEVVVAWRKWNKFGPRGKRK